MRAALYARVSTDEQKDNYSIPTQLETMREYAARHNLEVVSEYREDYTGTSLQHPQLDLLRESAQRGEVDIVVCYSLDRLSRKPAHQLLLNEEFAKRGVALRYVLADYQDTPEGRLFEQISGVMAEYEREKILERTVRGRRGRAKAGQMNIDYRRPYGYVYKGEKHMGCLLIR